MSRNEGEAMPQTLIEAAKSGNVDTVKSLLDSGALPNQVEDDGDWSALTWAACNGQLEVARLLLDHGADVNQVEADGDTPLHEATFKGHLETAKLLLDRGADVNQVDNGDETALHLAAQDGHTQIARLLLEGGANPDKAESYGKTPLHWAEKKGDIEIAQLLLDHGANPNQATTDGETPLLWAASNGHAQIARLLLEGGADVNQVRTIDGITPLYIAALQGHLETTRLLLGHGANPNQAMTDGMTPLLWAATSGHLEVTQLLLDHGADANQAAIDGITPLQTSVSKYHHELAQRIFMSGGRIPPIDNNAAITMNNFIDNVTQLAVAHLLKSMLPNNVAIGPANANFRGKLAALEGGGINDQVVNPSEIKAQENILRFCRAMTDKGHTTKSALTNALNYEYFSNLSEIAINRTEKEVRTATAQENVLLALTMVAYSINSRKVDNENSLPILPTEVWQKIINYAAIDATKDSLTERISQQMQITAGVFNTPKKSQDIRDLVSLTLEENVDINKKIAGISSLDVGMFKDVAAGNSSGRPQEGSAIEEGELAAVSSPESNDAGFASSAPTVSPSKGDSAALAGERESTQSSRQ